jgi:O-antigen ligase
VSFDRNLSTNYSRKEYFEVGTRMIRDHPLLGVGPQRVGDEYRNYFPETELDFYGHLHNNVIQIAAERGLLSLAAFVWFVVELYRSLIKLLRTPNSAPRWATLGALSAMTGFVVSGLAEYNFGDSEVILLMLFIVSIPFGLTAHVQEDPYRQQG